MRIAAGEKLGSYQILGLIGSGGQGEVYRALDSTLKRDVAIKVLPAGLAAESERVSRFQREAELLASLTHSNIAVVHDFQNTSGRQYLVMEFVDGETLADRLKRGPLPVDETLHIAKQVAEALEAAHQKGITHRDLKPANIKITPEGKVKVLDFGLAKMFESGPAQDASHSPTLVTATVGGVILGTAAYMSPEQARGKVVDKKTDIWALGCIIYESLTGKQAFAGDNISDTIAGILRGEPDWAVLPAETPRRLRELIPRCLQKDPHQRIHDAADVRIALEDAAKPEIQAAATLPRPKTHVAAIVALALLSIALSSALWWTGGRPALTPLPMHLSLQLGAKAKGGALGMSDFALSPDGRWLVYVAEHNGTPSLFLQDIREASGRFVNGTDNVIQPFFSFDSQWIAFASGGTLKKVPVTGGSPISICDLPVVNDLGDFSGGAWTSDDRIVFVPLFNAGIWVVPAGGGTPQILLKTDEGKDRIAYTNLQPLPNNKGILFTLSPAHAITTDDEQIGIIEPGSTEPRVLLKGLSQARYVPTGHIVYSHRGSLLAVPFDLSRLAVTGSPVSVIDGIETTLLWDSHFEISNNGTLVFEPKANSPGGSRLALVDRKGMVHPITDGRALPTNLSVSPNGKHVTAEVIAVNNDVWTYDIADGTPLRLTFEPGDEVFPQWTPDGTRIAFGTRIGKMFWKSADGTGQREEFPRGDYPRFPGSFSPDGKSMAFVEVHPSTKSDIWLMPMDGDRKPRPFLNTDSDESTPKFSPDGHWLAYVSDETGQEEIFIRPIGSPGGRKRISTGGGRYPAWNRNGREIFFVKGDQLISVALDAQMNRIAQEQILWAGPKFENVQFQANAPYYDVMPDGEHFVVALTPQYPSPTHYNVIVNWFEELKRR